MAYVKMTGTGDPASGPSEVVLERDDETGEPTKVVKVGEPAELNKEDQKKLEEMGFTFESSSKEEAQEYQEQQAGAQVGQDIAGAAPSLGSEPTPDQDADEVDQSST